MPYAEQILAAGAIAGALTGIGFLFRRAWRFARRIGHFLDDWNGEEARSGQPARPGIPEQVAQVREDQLHMKGELERVGHEVAYNGGSSIKDAVRRIEGRQAGYEEARKIDREAFNALAAMFGAFVGQEQQARISGHEATRQMFKAVEEVAREGEA